LVALVFLQIIILLAFGHSEIAIEGEEFVARERAGPFVQVRRRPLHRLLRLEITTQTPSLGSLSGGQQSWVSNQRELLYALRAYFVAWDPVVLAVGYPRAVLEIVAAELADLVEARSEPRVTRPGAPAPPSFRVQVLTEQDQEPPAPEPGHVRVSGEGGDLRIEFPTPSWAGRGGCVVLLGVLWIAVWMLPVLLICFGATEPPESWLALAGPLLGMLPGAALVVWGFLGLRKQGSEAIEVTEGTVRGTEPGLGKPRQRRWRREELTAVRCIANDASYYIRLDLANGQWEELISGNGQEMAWIAWRLRQALQLPEVPP
jgi:hypothetical protein